MAGHVALVPHHPVVSASMAGHVALVPHHPAVSASMAGHVALVPHHRLPKRLFYGEQGVRSQGGKEKCFKDTLKTSMEPFNMNTNTWEQTAMDRARWRHYSHKGANLCEERRKLAAQQQTQGRRARASNQEDVSHIPCLSCHRTFRARIDLISHLHTHKSSQPPQPQVD